MKDTVERSETAPPVIRRVRKRGGPRGPVAWSVPRHQSTASPAVVEYEPDTDLRETERVPLLEEGGIQAFLRREVLSYAPDAWYVPKSVKIGYEISFTRHFYKPPAPAPAGGDSGRYSGA